MPKESKIIRDIKTSTRYALIASLIGKKHNTVKVYFFRNSLSTENIDQVKAYLKKNGFSHFHNQ